MKQGLQLKVGQHLSMTPQLQQAIKLLQMSSLELQQEIQQALCSNPLLELEDDPENNDPENNDADFGTHGDETSASRPEQDDSLDRFDELTDSNTSDPLEQTIHQDGTIELADQYNTENQNQAIPDELPIDAQWDDIYQAPPLLTTSGQTDAVDFESYHSPSETLQDYLLWQLNLTKMSDIDRVMAEAVIDAIDEDGFLTQTVEEIWQGLIHQSTPPNNNEEVELEEVIAVLHRIQQFDPAGVGAEDLKNCLLIQLRQLHEDTPHLQTALEISEHYLPLVANREYPQLCRQLALELVDVKAAIQLIQTLSPRPGSLIRPEDTTYIVPDVKVHRESDRWLVALNDETTPKLRINKQYASYVKRGDNSPDNQFLRENLQEARWLLRSLESRNETLLRVALCIVEMQSGFLEKGPEAMKPMVLSDIAERLELHESTISRVTTRKYIDSPQGIYELKYFFSSHVSTDSGGECSSTAIRAMIKKIILEEPAEKPYSDNKLTALLKDRGIQIARRTVAKYRESLDIPSSSDRKRFKRSA